MKALLSKQEGKKVVTSITDVADFGAGDVVIKSEYSGVNFKDALGVTGKGSIFKKFPLIGGIDVAGVVAESKNAKVPVGSQVLVNGCGLGEIQDGGFAEKVRVPAEWIVMRPSTLSSRAAMMLGTAGFTAGLCLNRLELNGVNPDRGPIVVTGASGGVGSLATWLFSQKGYEVIAVSGKKEQHQWLKKIGASEVKTVEELKLGSRPLEQSRYQAAVDNVGGTTLAGLTRHIDLWGAIACVGLAESPELNATVMPMILRGVSLLGISSANCPMPLRVEVWTMWSKMNLSALESLMQIEEIKLEQIVSTAESMLARKTTGRTIVKI